MAQLTPAALSRILIIDDTPTNIETLVAVLENDYQLAVANSGAKALRLLATGLAIDLILLDVMMPDMDGFEVCAALKNSPATRDIPVIFVTARTDFESEARSLAVGAVDFIHKPIGKDVVRARVALHLALIAQRQQLESLNEQLTRSLADVEQANLMLKYLADHDPLTLLPNRMLFFDRVAHGLEICKRHRSQLALMFVDLDRFKPVNDTLGHAVGDEVLIEVARRMRECVRASDSLGRIGGDEFVVLLQDIGDETHALSVANKMRLALNAPFAVNQHSVSISASIGIVIGPREGDHPVDLAHKADEAMYQAKAAGGNLVRLYRPAVTVLREAGKMDGR